MSMSEGTQRSNKRRHEEVREHEFAAVTKANSKSKKTRTDSEDSDGSQGSVAKAKPKPSEATSRTTRGSGKAGEKKHTPKDSDSKIKSGTNDQVGRAKESQVSGTQDSGVFSGPSKDAKKKDTSSQRAHSSALHASETQKPCRLHKAPITSAMVCYVGYGIYIGSWRAVCTNFLKANNITHVLSLGQKPLTGESLEDFNWKYLAIEDIGDARIEGIFGPAFEFIDEGTSGTNKIMVHCQMGYSRSPAVVIGYLQDKKNYSWFQAFVWVARRRPQIWLLDRFRRTFDEKARQEGSNAVDFNLPGDNADTVKERVDANSTHLEKLHVSFSGCAEDSRKHESVVFWTEEAKESASSKAP